MIKTGSQKTIMPNATTLPLSKEMLISIIICTHNPNVRLLNEVLDALRNQTLATETWELLIIDNASGKPVDKSIDVAWHQQMRIVHEAKLGLTNARVRGILESQGELLIFVDDDNLLDKDYLQKCLDIANQHSNLGAWGGNLVPRYEVPPPHWFHQFAHLLAIRTIANDKWCNIPEWSIGACPSGAGMCIRRTVAKKYVEICTLDPLREILDRTGTCLMGYGDLDMAFTSCDMGMGTGVFARLSLTHVIPRTRIEKSYLLKLEEGNAASSVVMDFIRGKLKVNQTTTVPKSLLARIHGKVKSIFTNADKSVSLNQDFTVARAKGSLIGHSIINKHINS